MAYEPEEPSAQCSWCGLDIEYWPKVGEFPWATNPDTDTLRVCFDENPHVPYFDIVVTRAGASSRTADELVAVFVLDVADLIGGVVDENGLLLPGATEDQRSDIHLAMNVSGWCEDPDDSQALSDMIPVWEGYLCDAGYSVEWDDGYSIYRVAQ